MFCGERLLPFSHPLRKVPCDENEERTLATGRTRLSSDRPNCLLGISFLYSMRKPFPLATSSSSSSSSFIKQADSVKMAEYWPSPLFFPFYLIFWVVFFCTVEPCECNHRRAIKSWDFYVWVERNFMVVITRWLYGGVPLSSKTFLKGKLSHHCPLCSNLKIISLFNRLTQFSKQVL